MAALTYEQQIAHDNKANYASAQSKGLIDESGNYKQDELGRTYNTETAKWESGDVSRAGYTNEGGGGAITGSGGSISSNYGSSGLTSNEKYYQQLLAKTQSEYAAIAKQQEEAQRAAIAAGVGQLENNRLGINSGYDDVARQLYIDRRQAERKIPQQLAAQGYTGGLSESSNLNLQTAYQEYLSQGEKARIGELANLDTAIANLQASGDLSIAQTGAGISQNAMNAYAQIMNNLIADKRWAAELGLSQQQWSDQMAWNQQQWNASQGSNDYNQQLQLAQTLAEYGDFSGYSGLGVDTTTMQNYYQQLLAQQSSSKSSGSSSSSSGGGGNNGDDKRYDDTSDTEILGLSYLYQNSSSLAQFKEAAQNQNFSQRQISRFLERLN